MSRIAAERISVGVVRARARRIMPRVRFCALDGPVRVVIEADSEFDLIERTRSYAISTGHGNDLIMILRRAADALEQKGVVVEAVHAETEDTDDGPVHHFRFFWLTDPPDAA